MLNWQFKHYSELSINEFHDIIALRIAIFVVEQNCPYQELDGNDKMCHHLLCTNEKGELVGTLRILPPNLTYETVSIGRIVIHSSERNKGQGHEMMQHAKSFIEEKYGNVPITLSAQKHLEKFYASHNFVSTGKEYLEDGIPHVEMYYTPHNRQ